MDGEDSIDADTLPSSASVGPGAALRAAREALLLDLTHIAAETRITLRHLQAIEAGDFASLPSRTHAIGFSRSFAKAVGLDDAAITDAVRAELAVGTSSRPRPAVEMEPGDPARLPPTGLVWAAAGAALLLLVGVFAFYRSFFGAGSEPGSLLAPGPAASAPGKSTAKAPPATMPAGPVVLTALEDGIWVRIYEEGGDRLVERTLAMGETLEVPGSARDPRINTGRPDALGVTIGGQAVAKLADSSVTISGMPVSAAALIARTAVVAPDAAATAVTSAPQGAAPVPRPQRRRQPPPQTEAEAAPVSEPEGPAAPVAEPAPAPEPAPPPGR